MKINNPFTLSVYSGPKYFCDREAETASLIDAIKNNRHVTLVSYRRLGKSGLIKHVFYQLRNQKNLKLFYIDIMDTACLGDFVHLLAKEIIGKIDNHTIQFIQSFGKIVKSLRPKIAVDPLTGSPEILIDSLPDVKPEKSLAEIFTYLEKHKLQIVIALDEFQQILEYPEKNIEAILRKYIQQISNTTFIYSGSRKHILSSIFSDSGRPFYQSSEFINLPTIDADEYSFFITNWFKKGGKEIDSKAVKTILKLSRQHTYYVQYMANKLYGLQVKKIDKKKVISILLKILEEKEFVFHNYKKLLTRLQFHLLEAIAKEEGVNKPTSKDFIYKYNLGTPSSVKTALTALLNKEMVLLNDGQYLVYDVFFSLWLNRRKFA